jgi:O-antigen/teichoic acid export membrane protein
MEFLQERLAVVWQHLKIPFYTNAYALIALQGITAFLSLIFWVTVVRLLPVNQIGIAAALYSAAMLVVWLSGLGFDDGLAYYLPHLDRPNDLINASICVTATFATILSIGFVLGADYWAPELGFGSGGSTAITFVVCTVILQISILQDGLFVADRASVYVLIKGLFTCILRFPIFVVFLFTMQWDMLLSAALAFFCGTVVFLLVYRKKRRPDYRFFPSFSPSVWRPILGFSMGNYLINMILGLPNTLLPLIVLAHQGAESNAYFYVAWMTGNLINVIGRAFGTSIFVENGWDSGTLRRNISRSLKTSIFITIPAILILVLLARPLLLLMGKDYSAQATTLLSLIAISCAPLTLQGVAIGVLKAKGHVGELMFVAVIFTALHVGLGTLFASVWGLTGLGVAIIIARLISTFLASLFAFRSVLKWDPPEKRGTLDPHETASL